MPPKVKKSKTGCSRISAQMSKQKAIAIHFFLEYYKYIFDLDGNNILLIEETEDNLKVLQKINSSLFRELKQLFSRRDVKDLFDKLNKMPKAKELKKMGDLFHQMVVCCDLSKKDCDIISQEFIKIYIDDLIPCDKKTKKNCQAPKCVWNTANRKCEDKIQVLKSEQSGGSSNNYVPGPAATVRSHTQPKRKKGKRRAQSGMPLAPQSGMPLARYDSRSLIQQPRTDLLLHSDQQLAPSYVTQRGQTMVNMLGPQVMEQRHHQLVERMENNLGIWSLKPKKGKTLAEMVKQELNIKMRELVKMANHEASLNKVTKKELMFEQPNQYDEGTIEWRVKDSIKKLENIQMMPWNMLTEEVMKDMSSGELRARTGLAVNIVTVTSGLSFGVMQFYQFLEKQKAEAELTQQSCADTSFYKAWPWNDCGIFGAGATAAKGAASGFGVYGIDTLIEVGVPALMCVGTYVATNYILASNEDYHRVDKAKNRLLAKANEYKNVVCVHCIEKWVSVLNEICEQDARIDILLLSLIKDERYFPVNEDELVRIIEEHQANAEQSKSPSAIDKMVDTILDLMVIEMDSKITKLTKPIYNEEQFKSLEDLQLEFITLAQEKEGATREMVERGRRQIGTSAGKAGDLLLGSGSSGFDFLSSMVKGSVGTAGKLAAGAAATCIGGPFGSAAAAAMFGSKKMRKSFKKKKTKQPSKKKRKRSRNSNRNTNRKSKRN